MHEHPSHEHAVYESPSAPPSFLAKHGQKIIALLFWLLLLGIYLSYSLRYQRNPVQVLEDLVRFMQANPLGPLLYILIYTLRPLVFFSAVLLTLAGGFVFGSFWGIVYTLIGSNAGASLAFFLGRLFGGGIAKLEEQAWLQRWLGPMRHNSFETVLLMRFMFLPYDLVNYAAGLLRIHYGAFLLATVLGSLPGTLSFVLAGASLEGDFRGGVPSLNPRALLASGLIFAMSLLLSRYLKQRRARLEPTADKAA